LELLWADEFQSETLDRSKWNVLNEWTGSVCRGNELGQLHCNLDHPRNLQLRDGCLAIAATRETSYSAAIDMKYSAAMITTAENWTYGRFEIRAALPKGKMLRTAVYLVPEKEEEHWPRNGQIDILTNVQKPKLGNGAHYTGNYHGSGLDFVTGEANLQDFHTYAVQWNQTLIQWFFNETNRGLDFNIDRKLD
ncbi:unnamed protein product, partial [Oppiella nova]